MILQHGFILPWQKNWLKPPSGSIQFTHFDRSFRSFWLYALPIPFVVLLAFRFKNSDGVLPSDVDFLVNCVVSTLLIIGLLAELARPRFWKLFLSPDGAILQTLFSQHRLSSTQLAAIQESKRYGLSLLVPVPGGDKHLSVIGMKNLTTFRRSLDPYLGGDIEQRDQEFTSHFNISLVDLISRLTLGTLMISAFIYDGSWPDTHLQWTMFVLSCMMIVDGARSIYVNIGVKIMLTDEGLRVQKFKTKTIAWKDVTMITIHDEDDYHHARLNITTPDKTISIPESVINYWRLVQQVKARIPASAQVIES